MLSLVNGIIIKCQLSFQAESHGTKFWRNNEDNWEIFLGEPVDKKIRLWVYL
jgi:hypothetical protein